MFDNYFFSLSDMFNFFSVAIINYASQQCFQACIQLYKCANLNVKPLYKQLRGFTLAQKKQEYT